MPCPPRPHLSSRPPLQNAAIKGLALALLAALSACAEIGLEPASRSSTHSYRSHQPPEQAARCFGHNAEEHSSALISEVTMQENRANVVVSVRNGATYATADFRRSGSGSLGTITLNVVTSGSQRDLVASLTEGC
jgi:hypothetical protein